MASEGRVGVVVASATPPEDIGAMARLAEDLGFEEFWIPEDYWCLGTIAVMGSALSATSSLRVGAGVMSALVRHPSVTAMEIACLERMHPGRVLPGLGLGTPDLMTVMGYRPPSALKTLREGVDILRTLLAGEEYAADGEIFQAKGIKLHHPPARVPPIYTGVLGPKMVQLSGEVADGTVVSAMASPDYVRWLRGHVDVGLSRRPEGGGTHRLPTFAMYCVDDDPAAARAAVRPLVALYLSHLKASPLVTANPFAADVAQLCERGGPDAAALIEQEMPDEWLDALTVAGDPAHCARRIDDLFEAGADSVILMPVRTDDVRATLQEAADRVLPLVGRVPA